MEQREGLVKFQYITCYSLSFRWELHSVTVFLFQYITCYSLSLRVFSDLVRVLMFQYITCYSLSDVQHLLLVNYIGFNTSHVTLYLLMERYLSSRTGFNTSHVTLYRAGKEHAFLFGLFQYITCYSLSTNLQESTASIYRFNTSHVTLYLIPAHGIKRDVRFNTSHVTLYLEESEAMNSPEVFQYITCYSLSENQMQEQFPEIMFQYITCYSLSLQGTQRSNHCRVSIHHMLLFIEKMCEWNMAGNRVSIHHMLLFIVGIRFKTGPGNMFQYITCYSLSELQSGKPPETLVSIHHMLLFIRE